MEGAPEQEQPALPDMELVQYIEGMSVAERIEHKRLWLDQMSTLEQAIHMVNDVNEAEGVDVSIIY